VADSGIVELKDIYKVYSMGDIEVHALRGLTLSVGAGEWVAIMGQSGSGKSTLMHILGCLDTPTSGSYALDGTEVSGMSSDDLAMVRNEQIGFVFQSFNLLARTSALEQVSLPLRYRRNGSHTNGTDHADRAREALEMVGLAERLHHLPTELSGGQQQRVAIARALINDPPIVMADEPTGNLDSKSGEEILSILRRLHDERGITVVMVTHEEYIADQAERVIRLLDGEIVEDTRR
jgi:putative ABC transport system ATP-binding protein